MARNHQTLTKTGRGTAAARPRPLVPDGISDLVPFTYIRFYRNNGFVVYFAHFALSQEDKNGDVYERDPNMGPLANECRRLLYALLRKGLRQTTSGLRAYNDTWPTRIWAKSHSQCDPTLLIGSNDTGAFTDRENRHDSAHYTGTSRHTGTLSVKLGVPILRAHACLLLQMLLQTAFTAQILRRLDQACVRAVVCC